MHAHARTQEKAAALQAPGVEAVTGDSEEPSTLRRWLSGVDAVVDLRVCVPVGGRALFARSWREYARLRGPVAGQLVDCAIQAGVPLVVHDTVTMVYQDGADQVLAEDAPVSTPGALAANLEAERHLARLTGAGGRGIALRFGQFYGPDDVVSMDLLSGARSGRSLVLGDPQGFSSAVHTSDVGRAVAAALHIDAGVYNVVDDEPMRRREVVSVLARSVGRTSLRRPPSALATMSAPAIRALCRSQRVSAKRFRNVSGWRPGVPSRRSGWPEAAKRSLERSQ